MRKLFALAAVAMFALTLTLGTMGCAPKTEESTTPAETPAPAPETAPAPTDTTMGGSTDTTSHM